MRKNYKREVKFFKYDPIIIALSACVAGYWFCKNYRDEKFYIKIDQTTISLMQYLQNNDIIVCTKAKVSKILVNELFYILKKYLINYFEKVDFKSLEMLDSIKI